MERTQGLYLPVEGQKAGITIKSPQELRAMREAGRVVASVKDALLKAIQPGIRTRDLDAVAAREIKRCGAQPNFKGYPKPDSPRYPYYPATICVSINEEIVHGIPGDRVVKEGDVVSLDMGAMVDGFHGDAAVTVAVGAVPQAVGRLIEDTRLSLELGIKQAVAGRRVGDVSHAVQVFAEAQGYGVVREYVGHGIGRALHEEPSVPNVGEPGKGPLLRPGMVIAIEPMLNLGTWRTRVLDDGWTVVTADGSISAHFEHTVAITDHGPWVLTTLEGE
ncbi:MAG: type I methionyl aminopeptidase [Chloroflexi bacterium]|nr:type I methionyl aminopeptidase [Chloroflexota bacterium]